MVDWVIRGEILWEKLEESKEKEVVMTRQGRGLHVKARWYM